MWLGRWLSQRITWLLEEVRWGLGYPSLLQTRALARLLCPGCGHIHGLVLCSSCSEAQGYTMQQVVILWHAGLPISPQRHQLHVHRLCWR